MSGMDGAIWRQQEELDRLRKEVLAGAAMATQYQNDLARFRLVLEYERKQLVQLERENMVLGKRVRELEEWKHKRLVAENSRAGQE